MEKIKKPNSRRMLIGCLLLLLIVALTLTGVSFAEFISSTRNRSSSKVASFAFEALGSGEADLLIDCNDPEALIAEYSIEVTNEEKGRLSGAAAEYRIVVTLPQALPEGVSMTLKHQGTSITPSAADETTYSFAGAKVLAPNKKDTHSYVLRFSVTDPTLIREPVSLSGIQVDVIAQQVN